MSEPIKLELEIDLEQLKETIENAPDLKDNQELFSRLTEVYRAKQMVNDILDEIISIEATAKGLIKSKADALYGANWTAIKGKGYKITKSGTGAVYSIAPDQKPPKKFLVVKESLDSKLISEYLKETGKLPKGIDYNPSRGSSIRVTVQDNVE